MSQFTKSCWLIGSLVDWLIDMKVGINGLFLNRPTTGTGQYLLELLPALTQRDTQNEYALIFPRGIDVPKDLARVTLHPQNVAVNAFGLGENFAKLWFEQITFARACQRECIDLAHVPYFASPLFPRTRTIVTIHDLIPLLLPLYRGSLLVRAYTRLVAIAARRADAIIADSECSKRDIVRLLGVDASRVRVVYLAANQRYQRVIDTTSVSQKYSLPRSAKYLLYLGGFDQRKNVRVIIQAFSQLREFYDLGYRLVLAGVNLGRDSEFFPNPQRIAREVGLPDDAIHFTGWVDEVDKPALYSGATVFLSPSLYEGFGLPPLEAMACGVPVISSNASSLPEIVGDAGITIDPNDVDAWAEAIRTVLRDPLRRATMQLQSIHQARKFSWRQSAEETLAVYEYLSK
jgi:glycosyltransferase involved in cell wall biosynthesis